LKKETSFIIGAVTLLNLSISFFAKFLQPPKKAGSPILVNTLSRLPAPPLAELRNKFKKSALSVSKQLKGFSEFLAVYNEKVVDIEQILTNKQKMR